MAADNPAAGQTLENFLNEQGLAEDAYAAARKSATDWAASRPQCRCTALDVAAYLLEKLAEADMTPSAVKLHKLLYYAQAWSLVWDDRPLYPEPVEAWSFGPVVRTVYAAHEGAFKIASLPSGDASRLDVGERETADAVIRHYASRNAQYLQDLIRLEGLWSAARAGLSPEDRCGPEIPLNMLQEYYGSLGNADRADAEAQGGEIPENPANPPPDASVIPPGRDEMDRYRSLYRDRPKIFILTAIGPVKEMPRQGKRPLRQRTQRTWAWFPSLDLASTALALNDGDIHEDEFVMAVVEEIGAGMAPMETTEHWFSWDPSRKGFVAAQKPEDLSGITHFSIG